MKMMDPAQMQEATRLTRAGQLMEAVTLLQRALGGGLAASDAPEQSTVMRLIEPLTIEGSGVGDAPPHPTAAEAPAPMGIAPPLFGDWQSKLPILARGRTVQPADIAPAAGRYVTGSFSNGAGSLAYKLYIPSRHGDGPRPLIVMLHGCTQSADDFAAGTRMNFAAEAQGCFVVYPEQTQAANTSKCWNWFRSSDQARGRGEPALIAGITRQIMKDHRIDPQRVYAAGLSAGGAAAAIMGETYPDLYAAVGVHSGLACGSARDLPSAFAAMRGQPNSNGVDRSGTTGLIPTIVFHGDLDKTVHPCNGGKVIARATGDTRLSAATVRKKTASGHGYSRSVQRDAEGRSMLELWELHGAGHAWSGGSAAGSYTNPAGPDATKEMLRFFLQHRERR
jgi:poly(hydroxyalkanoate) depolymerase family esterase